MAMLKTYFQEVLKTFKAGDATEASFYNCLKNFIEEFSAPKVNITIQPRRLTSGIPDFVVRRDKELVGYIEAKDIGKDLEIFERTPQFSEF